MRVCHEPIRRVGSACKRRFEVVSRVERRFEVVSRVERLRLLLCTDAISKVADAVGHLSCVWKSGWKSNGNGVR